MIFELSAVREVGGQKLLVLKNITYLCNVKLKFIWIIIFIEIFKQYILITFSSASNPHRSYLFKIPTFVTFNLQKMKKKTK